MAGAVAAWSSAAHRPVRVVLRPNPAWPQTASGVWADCAPAPGQQAPASAAFTDPSADPSAGAGGSSDPHSAATLAGGNSSVAPIITDRNTVCQLPLNYEGVQVGGRAGEGAGCGPAPAPQPGQRGARRLRA